MDSVLRFINLITFGNRGFTIEIIICEVIFSIFSKFRKWRWKPLSYILLVAAVAVLIAVGFSLPLLPIPALTPLIVFALSILLQWLVLNTPINRILFNSVAAYAVQNLAVNFRGFLMSFFELRGWGSFIVRTVLTAAVYVFAYFVFARKINRKELSISYIHLYIMSFVSVFITSVLFALMRRSGKLDVYTYAILAICCLLALLYQFSTFNRANSDKETVTLERLLYYEQKQHDLTQETIDLINIKCHDLKKQVIALKEFLGDKAEGVLGDTEKVVSLYDEMVKTGNKNLDLIISEEKLYCSKHGVTIDVMADGAQLDFMSPADIYSLFSNALINAVESVMYEDEGNRNVGLDVHLNGDYVCIKITNVCTRPVKFVDGLPVTSKEDKKFHGYGIKSMEYIAEKYGGNMVVHLENSLFTVKIIIKKPS